MHPPSLVCQQLKRVHPHLRLAWVGRPKICEDEVNPGHFAVVQLFARRDVGTDENPKIFQELWHLTSRADNFGASERVRIERGPIFNSLGGTSPDWDPLFRVPVFAMEVTPTYRYPQLAPYEGETFCTADVFSGKIIGGIEWFLTPIKERINRQNRAFANAAVSESHELAGEMTDFLWSQANKADSTRTEVAYKHAKSDVARFDNRRQISDDVLRTAIHKDI